MNKSIKWEIKPFEALSLSQIYNMLLLRSEVFVVEQNCVYQDIDGKDQRALHVLGEYDGDLVSYARLFDSGDYFEEASIGRVIVKATFRGQDVGHQLMKSCIAAIKTYYKQTAITISAQLYLKKFYEMHDFEAIGESYLEDDIPHIRMKKER